jgi:hypothetical protein
MNHHVGVKIKIIFFIFCISNSAIPQNVYNGFLKEFYLDRQPSVKAIEMGRGLVASPECEFSSWYNPATAGLSEPVTANFSNISPTNRIHFLDYGVAFNSGKFGAIGFNISSTVFVSSGFDMQSEEAALYNINYAYQPVKNFFAGVNLNILTLKGYPESQSLYPIDIGVLKIFEFPNIKHTVQKLTIGSSLYDINNVKYDYSEIDWSYQFPLPVILRFGASYNFQYFKTLKPQKRLINLLYHFEIEKLLNSGLFTTYKTGAEISFIDLVSFRLGYFSRKLFDRSYENLPSEQHQITYGIGLKFSFSKWSDGLLPIYMQFEYTTIPQPSSVYSGFDNEMSLSVSASGGKSRLSIFKQNTISYHLFELFLKLT